MPINFFSVSLIDDVDQVAEIAQSFLFSQPPGPKNVESFGIHGKLRANTVRTRSVSSGIKRVGYLFNRVPRELSSDRMCVFG